MSVDGNIVRACTRCGHGYLKPCDGADPRCGNLLGQPGVATTKVEAQEGKRKGKKPAGYKVGKDILVR